MKIFVATRETQGQRANDFICCNEDEILTLGSTCTGATADDRCGCARSMVGIETRKATTTAKVIDSPMKLNDLVKLFHASDVKAGFGNLMDKATERLAAQQLADIANSFEVGDVIEMRKKGRGMTFTARANAAR